MPWSQWSSSAWETGCFVRLYEHSLWFHAGILDTAIVDRGRNVLSCSRDGTARLWDCGKSACLGVIADCGSPINGIAVGTADNSLNLGTPEKPPSKGLSLKIPLHFPVPNCLGLSPVIPSVWNAAPCPFTTLGREQSTLVLGEIEPYQAVWVMKTELCLITGLAGVLGSGGMLPQFSRDDPDCWVWIPSRFVA